MRNEHAIKLNSVRKSLLAASAAIAVASLVLAGLVGEHHAVAQAQQQVKRGAEPVPEPAITAILAAFDKYEVVGMSEAHGMKDVDDFIFSLIRNPAFSEKVNDIAVECGNSLYQPVLDRYVSGEDVPFTEVRKVWRNTTQLMCSLSGFFEQFFPLVRALNQKLPPEKRIRVLAGDPPIEWEQVKTRQDLDKFMDRDASITSVMEKEVLSKHRKALMLFGVMHLLHAGSAVSAYEKNYPGATFVISELAAFDTDSPRLSDSPFASWPFPSLALAKGTWLGALDLKSFFPSNVLIDAECNVRNDFPAEQQKTMDELVDAFLYLGPQDLRLTEQIPADIALDDDYASELQRREALLGVRPGAVEGPWARLLELIGFRPTVAPSPAAVHHSAALRLSIWAASLSGPACSNSAAADFCPNCAKCRASSRTAFMS